MNAEIDGASIAATIEGLEAVITENLSRYYRFLSPRDAATQDQRLKGSVARFIVRLHAVQREQAGS